MTNYSPFVTLSHTPKTIIWIIYYMYYNTRIMHFSHSTDTFSNCIFSIQLQNCTFQFLKETVIFSVGFFFSLVSSLLLLSSYSFKFFIQNQLDPLNKIYKKGVKNIASDSEKKIKQYYWKKNNMRIYIWFLVYIVYKLYTRGSF